MKVSELTSTIKAECVLDRTPTGRSVTEKGQEAARAALADERNQDVAAMQCLNCKFVCSSLLFEAGCKNCGSKDSTEDVIV